MKRVIALVVAAVLLGMAWFLGPVSRNTEVVSSPATVEQGRAQDEELVQPRHPPSERELEPVVSAPVREVDARARPSDSAGDRGAAPARKAPVRGRVIVAETRDPIRETLSVRLRTLDLERNEQFRTQSDGTFTSVQSYAPGVLLALVEDVDGRELVDHEASFDPLATEEWAVPVPSRKYPTSVRGTVVDRRGDPLDEVPVRLLPLGSPLPWSEALSDEDGRFELKDLRGGNYRMYLQGVWQRGEPLDVQLHAGANELGTLVLDEPRSAGLLVRFVCNGDNGSPAALVVVRPTALAREAAFYSFTAEERGGAVFELLLRRVPAGECTVTVESLDGRAYEPGRPVIGVPGELEIRVSGQSNPGRRLRMRDAETGEPIQSFDAWKRCRGVWGLRSSSPHGEWKGNLFLWGADAWVALASDHRGMRGSGSPDEDGIVEVALERGWSELLVFEDAEGDTRGNPDFGRTRPVLGGVEVFADGRLAGTSDSDGMLLLAGDGPPGEVAFHLQGWRVVKESRTRSLHQVWMVRER